MCDILFIGACEMVVCFVQVSGCYIEMTFKKQRPSVDHVRLESMTSNLNHFIVFAHTSSTQGS